VPPVAPIKRRELISYLRRFGFDGPYAGGKHEFMVKGQVRLRLPNPHQGDIGRDLLIRILHQAGIARHEWDSLA
jgi:predicted RNA binding protein YcfA (HicA-like mRNA interferase family)